MEAAAVPHGAAPRVAPRCMHGYGEGAACAQPYGIPATTPPAAWTSG